MNKFFTKIIFILLLFFLLSPLTVSAQQSKTIYLTIFWGDGCPHCHNELIFLDKLKTEFANLQIRKVEVWNSPENAQLMARVGQQLNDRITGVPFTIIGDQTIAGYLNDETTGESIRQVIKQYLDTGSKDIVGEVMNNQSPQNNSPGVIATPGKFTLPIFGEINVKNWSLPMLTVVIGLLDGFNPCAMWVLLFLITLLIGMEDRKKMWVLGSAFIISSALVYFLFMAAWLNLFLFLGFIKIIRIGVGLVAIFSGGYQLREWWINRKGGCRAADDTQREKIMNKLRRIASEKTFWLALFGIITLAASINLIELVCSAGLPALYTQVLAMSNLAPWQYYGYLLLYVFFYIFNELVVYLVAMVTFRAIGISNKYVRWTNFIGGIIIFILGVLLIFKPGLIMFG
jgi:thiol-disulfide isomerase/thioredoxin